MLKCPYLLRKLSRNWRNYNKMLKFSDAKNARKIDAFFYKLYKQISGKKSELAVDEQSENTPWSSNTMIDFIKQSGSGLSASPSSAESQFTHVAESETWF